MHNKAYILNIANSCLMLFWEGLITPTMLITILKGLGKKIDELEE